MKQVSVMQLTAIQRLFAEQSAGPRTITAIGEILLGSEADIIRIPIDTTEDQVLRLVSDGTSRWTTWPRNKTTSSASGPLESLYATAEWLDGLSCNQSDRHLVIVSGTKLRELMPPVGPRFPFDGVVVLHCPTDPLPRKIELQRALFDRGLIGIGSIASADGEAHCFLLSDRVCSTLALGNIERGRVSMSSLGSNGRFANQLFQYAFVRLYALRHGLRAELPEWDGKALFGLRETMPDGACPIALRFDNSMQDDRIIWEMAEPPTNVDFWGYFQELPACWRPHRPLLRRLFRLADDRHNAIDAWREKITRGGERTLVAIHVRRGDYRKYSANWLRLVPDEWYLDWLHGIWPTLRDPILFVATDEPESILPSFEKFDVALGPNIGTRPDLPDHVFDFEALRSADVLAICNSSFSRMAAILANDDQACFWPSFETRRFAPYDPWTGRFWEGFGREREEECGFEVLREQVLGLRLALGGLSRELSCQSDANAELGKQVQQFRSQNDQIRNKIAKSEKQLRALTTAHAATQRRLNAVLESRSWRITAPFRRCLRLLRPTDR